MSVRSYSTTPSAYGGRKMSVASTANASVKVPYPRQLAFDPRTTFVAPDFDVVRFVSDMRHRVPLAQLRTDLEKYLEWIQGEMVDMINRDYSEFISVSRAIADVGEAIEKMKAPLVSLKQGMDAHHEDLENSLRQVNEKLDERFRLFLKKDHVQRLLVSQQHMADVAKHMEHATVTLKRSKDLSSSDKQSALTDVALVSDLLVHVHMDVIALREEPFSIPQQKVDVLNGRFLDILNHLLGVGLHIGDQEMIRASLLAFVQLRWSKRAEDAIAQIAHSNVQHLFDARPPSPDRVSSIFDGIVENVKARLGPVMSVIDSEPELSSSIFVIGHCVWPVVVALVLERMAAIFSPGLPDAFQFYYALCQGFIERLEGLCKTPAQQHAIRAHSASNDFRAKWNMAVYFQLRLQEILAALDEPLHGITSSLAQPAPNGSSYHFMISSACFAAIRRCWSDDVFLLPICMRLLKTSFQIVSRFCTFISERISKSSQEWDMQTCLWYQRDLQQLERDMRTLFPQIVRSKTASYLEGKDAQFVAAIDASAAQMHDVTVLIGRRVVELVALQSSDALKGMRTLSATFRGVSRVPSTHSPYVSGLVAPLQRLANDLRSRTFEIDDTVVLQWLASAVDAVLAAIHETASEVLTAAFKTQKSLQKLMSHKKSASTTSDSASDMSDIDKIYAQLSIDVNEFVRLVGVATQDRVNAKASPKYAELQQTLTDKELTSLAVADDGQT